MNPDPQARLQPLPVAELRWVKKCYGEVTALDAVNLALRPGQVTALLGPNGAGKTTAVKLLLGLLRADSGSAHLFGGDPTLAEARTRVGAMMQISGVPQSLRVGEHIDLFSSYYPAPLPLAEVLAQTGLAELADRPYGKLSGGEQQRLLFALAICGDPDLLFLDEPTVGLDVESRRAFWEQVRRLVGTGRTVLLTTHYLEEADALADRIVVLSAGRVVADGTPAEIKSQAAAQRIRCLSNLDPEVVAGWPQVRTVRHDQTRLEILTSEPEAVVRRLLDLDPDLSELEVTGAGLEEAFLDLTRAAEPSATTRQPFADQKGAA